MVSSPSTVDNKLVINNNEYWSVNSILELIKTFYEYMKVIRFFKVISFEASYYLIDLIWTFNARTLELILGSGAY